MLYTGKLIRAIFEQSLFSMLLNPLPSAPHYSSSSGKVIPRAAAPDPGMPESGGFIHSRPRGNERAATNPLQPKSLAVA